LSLRGVEVRDLVMKLSKRSADVFLAAKTPATSRDAERRDDRKRMAAAAASCQLE
jgi:hypothetical protein